MSKNPNWTRDELIVALDFYLRHAPVIPGKSSREIANLSKFLRELQSALGGELPEKFRNHNSVYMKLMNFRRFDPKYPGEGLARGSREEETIWSLYYGKGSELRMVSDNIRDFVSLEVVPQTEETEGEYEGAEGRVLTRVHRYRERDSKLVRRKKEAVLNEHDNLTCEVCEFNFRSVYGDRGEGFIECHHKVPLSELSPHGGTTTLDDLSLVCSNCHRMIHKSRHWLSIEELRDLVRHASGVALG